MDVNQSQYYEYRHQQAEQQWQQQQQQQQQQQAQQQRQAQQQQNRTQSTQNRAGSVVGRVREAFVEKYEESKMFQVIAWVMFISVLSALAVIAWLNIAPYVFLFLSFGEDMKGENWLSYLIGDVANNWGKIVLLIAGILVWVLTQFMQILWLIIRIDRRAMRKAIQEQRKTQLYAREGDNGSTRQIIKRHNRVPYFFLRWSGFLSLAATAFDFALNFNYYAPAKDLATFMFAINTGMMQMIDGNQLQKLLISVCLFEGLLILAIVIWQWIKISKAEESYA